LANSSTQKAFSFALAAILSITPLGIQNYCVRTWRENQIRALRDFLSIRTQSMDLASAVFVKYIFESVYFFFNNPVLATLAKKKVFSDIR
jgi:hypothetical protein